jgi:hypothetical protein
MNTGAGSVDVFFMIGYISWNEHLRGEKRHLVIGYISCNEHLRGRSGTFITFHACGCVFVDVFFVKWIHIS